MRITRLIFLIVTLFTFTASIVLSQGDPCDFEYSSCLADCRAPGPPAPACVSKCNQAYANCQAGGVCSPFCN